MRLTALFEGATIRNDQGKGGPIRRKQEINDANEGWVWWIAATLMAALGLAAPVPPRANLQRC